MCHARAVPDSRTSDPSLSAFADHLNAPRGRGALTGAPHTGAAGGAACGDLVRIAVRVEGDRVAEAGFDASGCGAATAAASATVELVEGAPLLDAARVSADTISERLGSLPPPKLHAAALAADALHRALGSAAAGGAASLPATANRTLVAMSGGVDSTVAALLAAERGDEVVGVTLELWADADNDGGRSCCSAQAVTGARALAHSLGLPHLTLDLREQFRAEVVRHFVSEHEAGRTPNPCVRCNGLVRFDEMLALARSLGAARLATGHYARVEADADGPLLAAAADSAKDQTYMLARLGAEQLGRLWFPLAELTKTEVRAIAARHGLDVAKKPDSQDLCFLAGTRQEDFLRKHGSGAADDDGGEIVDRSGRVLGRHAGQSRFTVGQRRGIGIGNGEPLYVLQKDAATGRVTVGPRPQLATRFVELRDTRLSRAGARVDAVKLRYRSPAIACELEGEPAAGEHADLRVRLAAPVEGVAPGQAAVLLGCGRVIGCGTIAGGSA